MTRKEQKEPNSITVSIRLPEQIYLNIITSIDDGYYLSISDFIREAVRKLDMKRKQIGKGD